MPIAKDSAKLAREELLTVLESLPADHFDGPADSRIPPGDAVYMDWLLTTTRHFANQAFVVSQLMHQQGGDDELRELGPYGYTERYRVNQVLFFFLDQVLDNLLEMNKELVEGDIAPMRAFSGRRQGWFWFMGAAEGGALMYDVDADLLFVVKGLVSSLDFLLSAAKLAAPSRSAPFAASPPSRKGRTPPTLSQPRRRSKQPSTPSSSSLILTSSASASPPRRISSASCGRASTSIS